MLSTDVEEFKRERPEGVILQEGACRFCGQMSRIETLKFSETEDVDEAVTELCDCPEAKIYAQKKKRKERAHKAIENKFSKEMREKYSPLINFLKEASDMLADDEVTGVAVDVGNGLKIKMKITAKGGISVNKTVTKTESEEV